MARFHFPPTFAFNTSSLQSFHPRTRCSHQPLYCLWTRFNARQHIVCHRSSYFLPTHKYLQTSTSLSPVIHQFVSDRLTTRRLRFVLMLLHPLILYFLSFGTGVAWERTSPPPWLASRKVIFVYRRHELQHIHQKSKSTIDNWRLRSGLVTDVNTFTTTLALDSFEKPTQMLGLVTSWVDIRQRKRWSRSSYDSNAHNT